MCPLNGLAARRVSGPGPRWILCSIHGATYEPADGRCVGGPCGRGKLTPWPCKSSGGQVYWYPSRDIRPVPL
jgi:nitrite reductase/ring-hydroxylating ferredoxin subunit